MKQLLILSGKGGTGKTTIASSFISLLKGQHKTCFADCDVDVPNLHLIFSEGQTMLSQKTCFGKRAVINQSLCTHCGLCEQHCRFGADEKRRGQPLSVRRLRRLRTGLPGRFRLGKGGSSGRNQHRKLQRFCHRIWGFLHRFLKARCRCNRKNHQYG